MTTRITGLTSGLDVDSLVTAGASLQQSKLDKAKQQEQIYEWKQEQYREIQTSVSDFYSKYLDTTSSTSLTSSSIWNTKTFSSSSSAVTATATSADADVTNYTVSVTQLATAASYTIDSDTLKKLSSDTSYSIAGVDGISFTASDTDAATIGAALAISLNGDDTFSASYTAKYSSFANGGSGGLVITSNTMGNDSKYSKISFNGTDINKDTGTGTNLHATITNGNNTYTIGEVGEANVDNTANITSNNITLDNVKFTFNDVTTTTSGSTTTDSPVKLTGSNDVSDLADRISSFITDYNTLITTINGKLYESYDSDYQPLTDDEKEDMTESQIEKWETKAQTGLLKNDSVLQKLASDMKSAMSSLLKTNNVGLDLSTIGITAVADYTTKNGTYSVDTDALKDALSNGVTKKQSDGTTKTITFDDIKNLFTGGISDITSLTTSIKKENKSSSGILANLKVGLNVNATMTKSTLSQKAGIVGTTSEYTNELTELLKNQATLIDELEEKLEDKKDALYLKYSSLETSLTSLNSSSSIFSSGS